MRARATLLAALLLTLAAPQPAAAQGKVIELTVEILDRFFTAYDKEKTESSGVSTQLADLDGKISKFQQCKRDWEAAGAATGSRVGGLAARMAIRAKCGVSDDEGWRKDRNKIMEGPENAAASAGGFKVADYRTLRDRLQAYLGGDASGFSKASLDLLKSREKQLAAAFGVTMNVAGAGGPGGMGMRGPNVWTADYTWIWISQLFAVQYLSGATIFETDYKPGEWTRWETTSADNEGEKQISERAFIGKQTDGGEWWRVKTIMLSGTTADTVTLEALFKPDASGDQMQTLVRMRGKLPGNTEPQELMVPEQYAMWNMAGALGRRPTKESVDGATVGTESITTPAGTFRAKHVRFGGGEGTLDWWLDETAVGGWVKFAVLGNDKKARYEMQLVAKGTGATSELGVVVK